jgi:hypothetical protein
MIHFTHVSPTALLLMGSTLLVGTPLYSQTQQNQPAPVPIATFTPERVGDTGRWYLNFDTKSGWKYTVEESSDCQTWTPSTNGVFFGNGQKQKCFVCEGPHAAGKHWGQRRHHQHRPQLDLATHGV